MKRKLPVLIFAFALCASSVSAQNFGLAGSAKTKANTQDFGLANSTKTKANDVVVPSVSMTRQYGVKAILFEDDFIFNNYITVILPGKK